MSSYLDQLVSATKRTPGLIAGAPVDLSNLLMGLATGRGLSGYVDAPVSGSKQLNAIFGLDSPSGGILQDSAEAVAGLLTPTGAAKGAVLGAAGISKLALSAMEKAEVTGALGAMIVPARLLGDKSMQMFRQFINAESLGTKTAKELYDQTGLFRDKLGPKNVKGIIDDSKATLKTVPGLTVDANGVKLAPGTSITVKDLLNHPQFEELILKDPELSKIANSKVSLETDPRYFGGYTHSEEGAITMSDRGSVKDWMETLMHELQHAVQHRTGAIGGSNSRTYLEYPGRLKKATDNADQLATSAISKMNAAVKSGDKIAEMAAHSEMNQLSQDAHTLKGVGQRAYRRYLDTQGEVQARATGDMFVDPRTIKTFDPAMQDPARQLRAADMKLPDLAPGELKFDMEPSIKALIDSYYKP